MAPVDIEIEPTELALELAVHSPSFEPFRLLVLGNFGGSLPDLVRPRTDRVTEVNVDTLQHYLRAMRPVVRIAVPETGDLKIECGSLADFHPDFLRQSPQLAPHVEAIVRDLGFQEVETAWRSLEFLLERIRVRRSLTIHFADVRYSEVLDDMQAEDPAASRVGRILLADELIGPRWSVVAGLFTFQPNPLEIDALAALGRLSRQIGGQFLTAMDPRLAGAESLAAQSDADGWKDLPDEETLARWTAFRHGLESRWVGLVQPRFVLRAAAAGVEDCLWGSGALACACLMALRHDGEETSEITGVPLSPGDACAETSLSDAGAQKLEAAGIMPIICLQGMDRLWLPKLFSANKEFPGFLL